MITTQTVLEQLSGRAIYNALIEALSQRFEDFAASKERYDNAMRHLRREMGDAAQAEENAIEQQTAALLVFSGFLGLKANLDHFTDPIARNFLEVDTETYLRENTARRLPAYCQASEIRDGFWQQLTPEQKRQYEDITAYVSYLETAGPKLAHHFGYLLGNDLLPRIIPGYHPDPVLTTQYRRMLEMYFGAPVTK